MIPYGRQEITEDDIFAVVQALRCDLLTTGPYVNQFETALCEFTGAQYAIACSSATAALHLSCLALGITKGDVGVTAANTFLASANCIEYCGAKADFVDIESGSLCISPQALEEYCYTHGAPKVVIAVDFAGVPCHLTALLHLKEKFGFALIEDAAHSVGSTYRQNNQMYYCGCGLHSDLTVFSFHPVKNITTAEGGAVLTNNKALADRVRLFRSHGMTKDPSVLTRNDGSWYYEMHELGYHYRINDIQCALGISQLKRLSEIKHRRAEIVNLYNSHFSNSSLFITPSWPSTTEPCFHLYPLQLRASSREREILYNELLGREIGIQVHYIPVHLQPYYTRKYGYAPGKCPIAEAYYSRCLSLPLYASLQNSEVEMVSDAVLEISKHFG